MQSKKNGEQIENLKLLIETNQMIVEKMREVLADMQDRIDDSKAHQVHNFESVIADPGPRESAISSKALPSLQS